MAGRPCSGKTTIAYKLGRKSGLKVLYLDVFAQEMVQNADFEYPELSKWKNNSLVEILQDNPKKLFNEYLKFYRELFPLLLNELLTKYHDDLILESAIFLSEFVEELKKHFEVEVQYIKTSDDFVNEKYIQRDYVQEILKHDKGQTALNNLLERDRLYANELYKGALEKCYDVFEIKEEKDFDILYHEVEKRFTF